MDRLEHFADNQTADNSGTTPSAEQLAGRANSMFGATTQQPQRSERLEREQPCMGRLADYYSLLNRQHKRSSVLFYLIRFILVGLWPMGAGLELRAVAGSRVLPFSDGWNRSSTAP